MASRDSGTIDTMKVGIGIDFTQAKSGREEAKKKLKSLGSELQAAAKEAPITIEAKVETAAAKKEFDTLMTGLRADAAKGLTIFYRYKQEGDGPPKGAEPGGGPSSGGGGGGDSTPTGGEVKQPPKAKKAPSGKVKTNADASAEVKDLGGPTHIGQGADRQKNPFRVAKEVKVIGTRDVGAETGVSCQEPGCGKAFTSAGSLRGHDLSVHAKQRAQQVRQEATGTTARTPAGTQAVRQASSQRAQQPPATSRPVQPVATVTASPPPAPAAPGISIPRGAEPQYAVGTSKHPPGLARNPGSRPSAEEVEDFLAGADVRDVAAGKRLQSALSGAKEGDLGGLNSIVGPRAAALLSMSYRGAAVSSPELEKAYLEWKGPGRAAVNAKKRLGRARGSSKRGPSALTHSNVGEWLIASSGRIPMRRGLRDRFEDVEGFAGGGPLFKGLTHPDHILWGEDLQSAEQEGPRSAHYPGHDDERYSFKGRQGRRVDPRDLRTLDRDHALKIPFSKNADGGPSSLSDLPGIKSGATGITKVGERGPEYLVDMAGGGQFVVPNHQVRQFEGMQAGGWMDKDDFIQNPHKGTPRSPSSESPFFTGVQHGAYPPGETSKIHVGAVAANAQSIFDVVDQVAKDMKVNYKFIENKRLLTEDPDFRPGGRQQGKFITAYPGPQQGREMAERIRQGMLAANPQGYSGTPVPPSERRFAPDVPIAHRYVPNVASSGARYATEGGYNEPGARDFIGTYDPRRRPVDGAEALANWRRRRRGTTIGQQGGSPVPQAEGFRQSPGDPHRRFYAEAGASPNAIGAHMPNVFRDPRGPRPDVMYQRGWSVGQRSVMSMLDPAEIKLTRDVGPAGLNVGGSGTFDVRRTRAALAGLGGDADRPGASSSTSIQSRDIQRVAVVNWPSGLGRGGAVRDGGAVPGDGAIPGRPSAPRAESLGAQMEQQAVAPPTKGRGGPSRLGTFDPARQESRVRAETSAEALFDEIAQARGRSREALQLAPVRALSVSFGQIAQTIIGGRAGILDRQRISDRASARAEAQARRFQNAQAREFEIEAQLRSGDFKPGDEENLRKALADTKETAKRERKLAEPLAAAATERSKEILSPFQQVRAQAVGLVGIVGGTLTFTAAMQLAQVGVQAIGEAAKPIVDAMSGFQLSLKEATDNIAKTFQAAGGAPEGVFGALLGGVGITTARDIASSVGEFAQRQAGNENLRDAVKFVRATEGARNNLSPYAGLTQPTGGIAGSPVLATPGTLEIIAGQVPTSIPGQVANRTATGMADIGRTALAIGINRGQSQFAGNIGGSAFDAADMFASWLGIDSDAISGDLTAALRGNTEANEAFAAQTRERMDFFNNQMKDAGFGGPRLGVAQGSGPMATEFSDADTRRLELTAEAFKNIPGTSETQVDMLKAAGVFITGLKGGDLEGNTQKVIDFLDLLNTAGRRPSRDVLLETMKPALQAQSRGIARQLSRSLEFDIPVDFAQQMLNQPLPGMVEGSRAGQAIIAPNAGAFERGVAGPFIGQIEGVNAELIALREDGVAKLSEEFKEMGIPTKLITDVTKLGEQIAFQQEKISEAQLGLEQAQYNEQIFLTKRGISDLIGLNGQMEDGASRLGILQRQQIMDGRELARIQLARAQREINLGLALSRLRAPGETAEERAVRRDEAEMLAKERQRELDINKRSTGRGFQIQDIQLGRQLRDAVAQLGLLQQARAVTIEVRGRQGLIAAQQAMKALKNAALSAAITAVRSSDQMARQTQQSIEERAGSYATFFSKQIQGYMRQINTLAEAFLMAPGSKGDGTGGRARQTPQSQAEYKESKRPSAFGGIHMVSGTQGFVAGEAGQEAVIVLRNPKVNNGGSPGMAGRGGGGIKINIQLNAEVRNEADENRLTRKVANMLHDEVALLVGT